VSRESQRPLPCPHLLQAEHGGKVYTLRTRWPHMHFPCRQHATGIDSVKAVTWKADDRATESETEGCEHIHTRTHTHTQARGRKWDSSGGDVARHERAGPEESGRPARRIIALKCAVEHVVCELFRRFVFVVPCRIFFHTSETALRHDAQTGLGKTRARGQKKGQTYSGTEIRASEPVLACLQPLARALRACAFQGLNDDSRVTWLAPLVHMVISRTGLFLPAPARPGEPAPPLSRAVTREASLSAAGAKGSRCRWAQASAVTARVHAQTTNRSCRPNARPWTVGIAAVARPPPGSPFPDTTWRRGGE